MNYVDLIVSLRAKLNLSQQELAFLLHVSFATVNRWENNKSKPTRRHVCMLKFLCDEHGIKLEDFCNE